MLQQTEALAKQIHNIDIINKRIQDLEEIMIGLRAERTQEYLTHGEFNVNLQTIVKELELSLENKMAHLFSQIKEKIEDRITKSDFLKDQKKKVSVIEF